MTIRWSVRGGLPPFPLSMSEEFIPHSSIRASSNRFYPALLDAQLWARSHNTERHGSGSCPLFTLVTCS